MYSVSPCTRNRVLSYNNTCNDLWRTKFSQNEIWHLVNIIGNFQIYHSIAKKTSLRMQMENNSSPLAARTPHERCITASCSNFVLSALPADAASDVQSFDRLLAMWRIQCSAPANGNFDMATDVNETFCTHVRQRHEDSTFQHNN